MARLLAKEQRLRQCVAEVTYCDASDLSSRDHATRLCEQLAHGHPDMTTTERNDLLNYIRCWYQSIWEEGPRTGDRL